MNPSPALRSTCTARDERLLDTGIEELENTLLPGDVVFTRIPWAPFRQIATATGTWTNHVGVVMEVRSSGAVIAESRFPISCRTSFRRFVRRSDRGRTAVLRLPRALSEAEVCRMRRAVERRLGRVYDTGFNIRSRRQFCSRFVHEVLLEATGEKLGQVASFRELLAHNPDTDLRLWRAWYFGRIPWERVTITPASLYSDDRFQVVFDGTLVSK